jgi:hypothetical protein
MEEGPQRDANRMSVSGVKLLQTTENKTGAVGKQR